MQGITDNHIATHLLPTLSISMGGGDFLFNKSDNFLRIKSFPSAKGRQGYVLINLSFNKHA